jgi:hypothetical protein
MLTTTREFIHVLAIALLLSIVMWCAGEATARHEIQTLEWWNQ